MKKLSEREFKCLEEMAKMTGPYHWMPATVRKLVDRGYAQRMPMGSGYRITDEGREFLKGFPK